LGHCELTDDKQPARFEASEGKQFVLKTSRIDARQSGYVLDEGQYQLRIQVSAANSESIEAWFQIQSLPGWSDTVENLIRKGHTRVALLGQRPQSILGAVEEHFRHEMTIDS
jgi:hypothetical protein